MKGCLHTFTEFINDKIISATRDKYEVLGFWSLLYTRYSFSS